MKKKDNDIIKLNNEDSDRVVADMNIEGMPWHVRSQPVYEKSKEPVSELSKKEMRRITLSATLAGLLIGLVFLVIFALFILFSINIWFR